MAIIVFDASRYSNSIKNWWVSLVLALMFFIVGILVFTRPGETYLGLALLFGIMVVISGICEIFVGIGTPPESGRTRLIAMGVIELLLGAVLLIMPEVFWVYLPYVLGFWIMFRGYTLISTSGDMIGYRVGGAGLTLTFAILAVFCSFGILINPFFMWGPVQVWIGIALLLLGVSQCVYAVGLRNLKKFLKA